MRQVLLACTMLEACQGQAPASGSGPGAPSPAPGTTMPTGPSSAEVCNGVDDDGDGLVDDADPDVDPSTYAVWFVDGDGDGWGAEVVRRCAAGPGEVAQGGDCDDTRSAVHPGAGEQCGPLDEDCDGLLDEADPDLPPALLVAWFEDGDGDGVGGASGEPSCEAPVGSVRTGGDCDDADPSVGAAVTWAVDEDGDGAPGPAVLETSCEAPEGAADASLAADCDDLDPARSPTHVERCGDGVDNDCDGVEEGCDLAYGDLVVSGPTTYDLMPVDVFAGDAGPWLVASALGPITWHIPGGVLEVFPGDVRGVVDVEDAPHVVRNVSRDGWLGADATTGADFDGDGYTDLAVATSGPHAVHTLSLFPGPWAAELEVSESAVTVHTGDRSQESEMGVASDLGGAGPSLVWGLPGAPHPGTLVRSGVVAVLHEPLSTPEVDLHEAASVLLYGTGDEDGGVVGDPLMLVDATGDGVTDLVVSDTVQRLYGWASPLPVGGDVDDAPWTAWDDGVRKLGFRAQAAAEGPDGHAQLTASGHQEFLPGLIDVWVAPLDLERSLPGTLGAEATCTVRLDALLRDVLPSPAASSIDADVDGDGEADLAIGVPDLELPGSEATGGLLVFFGPCEGMVEDVEADVVLAGAHPGEGAGDDVVRVPDVDGDGRDELWVGTPRAPSGSRFSLLLGREADAWWGWPGG